MKNTVIRALCIFLLLQIAAAFAYANGPGSLDLTFAGAGYKFDGFPGGLDIIQKTVIQPDGKIVAAGYTSRNSSSFKIALARYNPDGTPDLSFNGSGKVITAFSVDPQLASSVALQTDGKIVVAGYIDNGTDNDILIVRYNSNGSLDLTFDGDGKVTTAISGDESAADVGVQPDGKIVAAGGTNGSSVVVRYNSDGSLDTTFDGDGIVITSFASGPGGSSSVLIQPDGKIVTAGNAGTGLNCDFALARYNPDGSLDTTFEGDGVVITPFISGLDDFAYSVALAPGGKIVAVGGVNVANVGTNYDFAIARYNADGSLDNTFDGDGKLTATFGIETEYALSVKVQADGKVVAAGYHGHFGVLRLNTDGSFDNSFDGDGRLSTSINELDIPNSVFIQSDGRVLAAGFSRQGGNAYDFALVRYLSDGSLDPTFDSDGIVVSDVGYGFASSRDAVVQPDGKILAAANSSPGFALTRYNTDGSLDTSFGIQGRLLSPGGSISDLLVQPDGKILHVGSSGSLTTLTRYNPDGSPDSSFGTGGKTTTNLFGTGKMALQPDGKIVMTANRMVKFTRYFVVARFNTDGSFDSSFDSDGYISTTAMSGAGLGSPVFVQPDGKIVAGGSTSGTGGPSDIFALIRFNPNGAIDTTFGSGGVVSTQMLPNSSVILSIALLPDGRIVAGGLTSSGTLPDVDIDFGVARYNSDGSLDTSFDGDGKAITPVLSGADSLRRIAVQADGRVVAAGHVSNGAYLDIALVRYNTDGSLDSTYGSGGKAIFSFGFNDTLTSLDLDPSGKAVVMGSTDDLVTTARITSDFAALVNVGGRVTSTNGQGISNATIILKNANNERWYALTNAFGYYGFSGVSSNETYVVSVSNKRYRFQPPTRSITLMHSVADVDFVGNTGTESLGAEKPATIPGSMEVKSSIK